MRNTTSAMIARWEISPPQVSETAESEICSVSSPNSLAMSCLSETT